MMMIFLSRLDNDQVDGCQPPAATRAGMSLLELMLVLALMVFVMAVAIPAIRGPLENQRLRRGGELVRIELGKARVRAMESGRTQMFRYELDGPQFRTEPLMLTTEVSELSATARKSPQADSVQPTQTVGNEWKYRLPEGVVFYRGDAVEDARSQLAEQQGSSPLAGWSSPILFYPDGTSSDAQLVLRNERQRSVAVRLRGLTGIPVASGVLAETELPP